ncbi:MAG: hypothetical protein ACYDEQ_09040, partial [Desulfocucumaceae bacterium]
ADRSGEVSSPSSSGDLHIENKGSGGGPVAGAKEKSPQDKGFSDQTAGKTVNPDSDNALTAESADSLAGEAARAEKVKAVTEEAVQVRDTSVSGEESGGNSSGGGGKSSGGSSGGRGKSGGGGRK